MPFPHGHGRSAILDNYAVTTLFSTITLPSRFYPQELSLSTTVTQVEFVILTGSKELPDDLQSEVSSYFNECIEHLNVTLLAYINYTKDHAVHLVNLHHLPPVIPAFVIRVSDWTIHNQFLLALHFQVPTRRSDLDQKALEQLELMIASNYWSYNPIRWSDEMLISSKRHFFTGDYRAAVIFAQAAIETAFLNLLFLISIHQGKSRAEAESYWNTKPFKTILKTDMHSMFGGRWNLSDTSCPPGRYHTELYQLRNRVVHGGHYPLEQEAFQAIGAAVDLIRFVSERIDSAQCKYPFLRKYIHGPRYDS